MMPAYLDGGRVEQPCGPGPMVFPGFDSSHNELQLLAALHALEWFTRKATRISIRVRMANVTAVSYINKPGGTKSASLNDITQRIVSWCEMHLHALDCLKGLFFSAWNHDIRGKVHSLPLICRPPPPGFTACEKKKINFKNESAKKKF